MNENIQLIVALSIAEPDKINKQNMNHNHGSMKRLLISLHVNRCVCCANKKKLDKHCFPFQQQKFIFGFFIKFQSMQ